MEAPSRKHFYINSLPPLGILGLASFLRGKGFTVDTVDLNISSYNYADARTYDLVGFSLLCSNIQRTLDAARKLHRLPGRPLLVAGGAYATMKAEDLIKTGLFDAVFVGEAEEALFEYAAGMPAESVRGLYITKGGEPHFTGKRLTLTHLDALPAPDLSGINLGKYRVPLSRAAPISHLITSRGCPGGCIFCFHHFGRNWRARSAANVVEEIKWQVKKFGVREISISDDNFCVDRARVEEILERIADEGINVKIQFIGGLRADMLDKDLLVKMKQSGVWLITVAPETGNAETLERIKKGQRFEDVERVVGWCKELGLATRAFFMIGFPWETPRHVQDTIDFALRLDPDFIQISRVLPFEGTELGDTVGVRNSIYQEGGLFFGGRKCDGQILSDELLGRLIRRAYRSFYLRPGKILRLSLLLSPRDLLRLAAYALRTESM